MIVLTRTRRIDWPRIIENLRTTGLSVQEIADEVDIGRRSIGDYCDDRAIEPAFWVGSALLVLWEKQTGLSYVHAPVRTVTPSVSAVLRESAA